MVKFLRLFTSQRYKFQAQRDVLKIVEKKHFLLKLPIVADIQQVQENMPLIYLHFIYLRYKKVF
jgi:hypothetical protein